MTRFLYNDRYRNGGLEAIAHTQESTLYPSKARASPSTSTGILKPSRTSMKSSLNDTVTRYIFDESAGRFFRYAKDEVGSLVTGRKVRAPIASKPGC